MTLICELVGPFDDNNITDATDIVDMKGDFLNAFAQCDDAGANGFAADNRIQHHRVEYAVFGEQIAYFAPLPFVPGCDHFLHDGDFWVLGHGGLILFCYFMGLCGNHAVRSDGWRQDQW